MTANTNRLARPLVVGAAGFLGSALVARLARGGVPVVAARCFSVFGPAQRKLVVHDVALFALSDEDSFRVGAPGFVVRDFAFIDDVVDALVGLARASLGEGRAVRRLLGQGELVTV